MKANVVSLDSKAAGDVTLNADIFGLEPRKDILFRVIEWQRANARAGTHKTKSRSEVSGTGKKPFKQKGTGNARQGTLRAPHHEGGGRAHGPVVRTHNTSLNKKIRALGLKMALSAKQKDGLLFVVEVPSSTTKTKDIAASFIKHGFTKPLIIDGEVLNEAFAKSARNIKNVNLLPSVGANVFDIMRHKQLILTTDAVKALEARFAKDAKPAKAAKAPVAKKPDAKAKATKKPAAKKPAAKAKA